MSLFNKYYIRENPYISPHFSSGKVRIPFPPLTGNLDLAKKIFRMVGSNFLWVATGQVQLLIIMELCGRNVTRLT